MNYIFFAEFFVSEIFFEAGICALIFSGLYRLLYQIDLKPFFTFNAVSNFSGLSMLVVQVALLKNKRMKSVY